jgi:hypothetical protein
MGIIHGEKELFTKWKLRHKQFVTDGVFDEPSYLRSKTKLLFLLKEANSDEGGWDLRERIRTNKDRSTWDDLARWAYGLSKLPEVVPWSEAKEHAPLTRTQVLAPVAAMNLKKGPGGGSTVESEFIRIVEQDADMIRDQFNLYGADLVVCCGSLVARGIEKVFANDLKSGWYETRSGFRTLEYSQKKFIIAYYHPEAHFSDNLKYLGIITAARDALGLSAK